jgi:hypothetical protein
MATPENLPAGPAQQSVLLELRSLLARYPNCGAGYLNDFGPALVHRLAIAPLPMPDNCLSRPMTVHRRPPGCVTPFQQSVIIGWRGDSAIRDKAIRRGYTAHNQHRLTEDAAIGVMFLLMSELEGATDPRVEQIGAGGDYNVLLPDGIRTQVEVSGVQIDPTGSEARKRLSEKSAQVLTHADRGFACVTHLQLL